MNNLNTIISSSSLYTTPSFFKGMVRIVDLFGQLDQYNYKKTEAEADTIALKRDWKIIGLDIAKALTSYAYGKRTTTNPRK